MTPTKIEAFNDWLKTARPGQHYVYHTGYLSHDRGSWLNDGNGTPDHWEPFGNVDELGRTAMDAYSEGKVHLFQRKLHDTVYQYIAVKRYQAWRNW